jgi:hypothetical protein
MNAICAWPKPTARVASSCDVAIRSPAGMLQAASVRVAGNAVVIRPMTALAIGVTMAR